MSYRDFRITFTKGARTQTLVYPGHTPYDAERSFTTDHPAATVLSVNEDTTGITNTLKKTGYGPPTQMGDYDGDVSYFKE